MKAKRLISCLCAALLVISLLQPQALAELTNDGVSVTESEAATRVSIEELLAAGDYVEGEASALVRADASEGVVAQGEELATASAESVELAADGS